MPSDTPDQRRRAAELLNRIGAEAADTARDIVHTGTARSDVGREPKVAPEPRIRLKKYGEDSLEAGDQGNEQAQQSMFKDIDAILARVESAIAVERAAMNGLLDRLSSAA